MRHCQPESVVQMVRDAIAGRCRHMAPRTFLMVAAAATGLVTGVTAFLLKKTIEFISAEVTGAVRPHGFTLWFVVLALCGIILSAFFQRYVVRDNVEQGCSRIIMRDLRERNYNLKKRDTIAAFIASSLTLGFGGSAGAEGPIAFTGGAIGSNLGRFAGARKSDLRLLIGIGAGAGIAGIFQAPLGGMLFTLEVMAMPMTTWAVMALALGCVTSAMTSASLAGFRIDFSVGSFPDFTFGLLPAILLLGLFCGLYSVYYNTTGNIAAGLIVRIRTWWGRAVVSGLMLGACVSMLPMLYGEGYSAMGKLMSGDYDVLGLNSVFSDMATSPSVILLAGAVLLLKGIAKVSSTRGGGVGGDFAPTLFAGCVAGFFFAQVSDALFGLRLPAVEMAFVGMAGVMAGAVRAPLMAAFLVAEMSGTYRIFFPIVIVAAVSYATARIIERVIRNVKSYAERAR